MEIVWLIGYVFSVGYCDILSIKGFWASIGVIILFAILWPLFLGVEMRDIIKSSNVTVQGTRHLVAGTQQRIVRLHSFG